MHSATVAPSTAASADGSDSHRGLPGVPLGGVAGSGAVDGGADGSGAGGGAAAPSAPSASPDARASPLSSEDGGRRRSGVARRGSASRRRGSLGGVMGGQGASFMAQMKAEGLDSEAPQSRKQEDTEYVPPPANLPKSEVKYNYAVVLDNTAVHAARSRIAAARGSAAVDFEGQSPATLAGAGSGGGGGGGGGGAAAAAGVGGGSAAAAPLVHDEELDDEEATKQRTEQVEVLRRLISFGMDVTVLATTIETPNKLVLMLSSKSNHGEVLVNEERRLQSERFLKYGVAAASVQDIPDAELYRRITPAREVFLTERIVDAALAPWIVDCTGYDVDDPDAAGRPGAPRSKTVVLGHFPVHDEEFNKEFMRVYLNKIGDVFRNRHADMDNHVNQLRHMFGERVAFYFSFVHFYTMWLLPLVAFCVLYYLVVRLTDWGSYVRGMSVIGWAVPTVWGTLMLRYWERRTKKHLFDWRIDRVPDAEYPNNNNPAYKIVKNPVTHESERKYDPDNNRKKVIAKIIVFAIINAALLIVIATPFIQWYAYGKMAPVCDECHADKALGEQLAAMELPFNKSEVTDGCSSRYPNIRAPTHCEHFVSCFYSKGATVGTDRWVYILIQGIILGLVLDVAQFEFFVWATERFTESEHWGTEAEHEQMVIRKQFIFLFVNWFFWFLFLAYAYVPYGASIFTLLEDIGLGATVPGYGWEEGVINLDEFFVTPLVVTQSLNLFLETFIPVFATRAKRRAIETRRKLVAAQNRLAKSALVKNLANVKDQLTPARLPGARRGTPRSRGDSESSAGGGSASKQRDGGSATSAEAAAAAAAADDADGTQRKPQKRFGTDASESARVQLAIPGGVMINASVSQALMDHGQPSPHSHAAPGLPNAATARMLEEVGADVVLSTGAEGQDLFDARYPQAYEFVHTSRRVLGEQDEEVSELRVLLETDDTNKLDATEVVEQGNREPYHPRKDYLDIVIQFAYVNNFTVAWPLAPVCALINNLFEVRGDAFKIMYTTRRTPPREDKGIGEWLNSLKLEVYFAVPIVAVMIVLSTGHAEWWVAGCQEVNDRCELNQMTPDFECMGFGVRFAIGLVLEHLAFFVIWVLRSSIPDTPADVQAALEARNTKLQHQIRDKFLPALPDEFQTDLREVYKAFDASNDNYLDLAEAARMMEMITAQNGHSTKQALKHMPQLFEFMDVTHRGKVTFAECAYALARAEQHPTLRRSFGVDNLVVATSVLAMRLRNGDTITMLKASAS